MPCLYIINWSSWMAGAQGESWVRRRIEEPVTQHLEAEGLDFLQFTFRRALTSLAAKHEPSNANGMRRIIACALPTTG